MIKLKFLNFVGNNICEYRNLYYLLIQTYVKVAIK